MLKYIIKKLNIAKSKVLPEALPLQEIFKRNHVIPLLMCVALLFISGWTLNYAEDSDAEKEAERIAEEQRLAEEEKERQAEEAYRAAMEAEAARQAEIERQAEEAYRAAAEEAAKKAEENRIAEELAYQSLKDQQTATPQAATVSDQVAGYAGGTAGMPVASTDSRWVINEDGSTTFKLGGLTLDFNVDEYIANVDEIQLFYQCVQTEAGSQSSLGRRLVADVILNRVASPRYPNTIKEVILQPGSFEVVTRGYIFAAVPTEATIKCVDKELEDQVDYGVMYFRTDHFFTEFGVPFEQVGAHYFSKAAPDDFNFTDEAAPAAKDVQAAPKKEEPEPTKAPQNKARVKDSIK